MNLLKDAKSIFLNKCTPEPNTGCWLWDGPLMFNGYTRVRIEGEYMIGHRLSYETFIGPVGDFLVCHKCDTPSCINPNHLFLGTKKDNTIDMINKGRAGHQRIKACPSGHEYSSENTKIYRNGVKKGKIIITRKCITCYKIRRKKKSSEELFNVS